MPCNAYFMYMIRFKIMGYCIINVVSILNCAIDETSQNNSLRELINIRYRDVNIGLFICPI